MQNGVLFGLILLQCFDTSIVILIYRTKIRPKIVYLSCRTQKGEMFDKKSVSKLKFDHLAMPSIHTI